MSTYSVEANYNVWDDELGAALTVGPDSDGTDWVEIAPHHSEKSQKFFGKGVRLVIHPNMARKLGEVLIRAADDLQGK